MSTPLVTVAMITWNHETLVGEAIRSVLDQTFADWELVVVNDGSTDGTQAVIDSFRDPRIRAIAQANQGPSVALNNAIAGGTGKYIALMSGDDVCRPDRLRRQVEAAEANGPCVLFSDVDFIDDNGQPICQPHFAATLFDAAELSRAKLYRRFFTSGNCLNAPTAFFPRAVFDQSPRFDPVLFQTQDFDLWVQLIKRCDFRVLPEKLLGYRIRGDGENLSSPDVERQVRAYNEHYLLMRRFFDGCDPEFFREAFADMLARPQFAGPLEFACEQALLFLQAEAPLCRLLGIEKLQALLNDRRSAEVLAECYGWTAVRLANALKSLNVMNLFQGHETGLFLDTGHGWNPEEQARRKVNLLVRDFCITFRLPAAPVVRSLRWDPVEGQFSKVRLTQVEVSRPDGTTATIEPHGLACNGTTAGEGWVTFDTFDPWFVLPVEGQVASVTLRGQWEFIDGQQAFARMERLLQDKDLALRQKELELQAVLGSKCWKLTAPIRAAGRMLRPTG